MFVNVVNAVNVKVNVLLGVLSLAPLNVIVFPLTAVTTCLLIKPVPVTIIPTLIVPVIPLTVNVFPVMLTYEAVAT